MKHIQVSVTHDFLKSLFHELMWKRACDTASRWWSARVILFTINCLIFTSGVCICIIFTVFSGRSSTCLSTSRFDNVSCFFVVPNAKSSGFWGFF